MTDLAAAVRAAIDETERIAEALTPKVNRIEGIWSQDGPAIRNDHGHLVVTHTWPNEATHIIRHDPAAVLRRCAADRELLEAYEAADLTAGSGMSPEGAYANGLEFAVRLLADAYGIEVRRD